MSTALSTLIHAARTRPLDASAKSRLDQQLRSIVAYTAPDADDLTQALQLGVASTLSTLFESSRLTEAQKQQMATGCLMQWSRDPFSFNVREPLLATLLVAGAQCDTPDYRGKTARQLLVDRLTEFKKREMGRARESGATTQLRQWIASMTPHQPTRIQGVSDQSPVRHEAPRMR